MNWINELISGTSVGHSILLLAVIVSAGILFGKIKIKGISLGATFILFVGIICGHLGLKIDPKLLDFLRDFGLILFVYAIGMQVGPSFFSSFKKGGMTLNLLAVGVVFLGAITALIIGFATGIDIPTMVGIMSGAVTNTRVLVQPNRLLKR